MDFGLGFVITVLLLGLALLLFWVVAIAPRTQNRPSLRYLQGYDYAHRGLHGGAVPENSMAAFVQASQQGFGMEFDLQLTRDGHVVIHHDNSLLRICGVDQLISDLTLAELAPLRLSGTEEGIPLFTAVLKAVSTPLIIELKGYGDTTALCEKTWEILKNYQGPYCIEAFHPKIVAWFKTHVPQVVRGQLMAAFSGGSEGLNAVTAFLARNMFTNIYTRPDFEAYDYHSRKKLALRLSRRLYGMQEVSWTLRDKESYRACKRDGCLCIFEGFDPREVQL